MSVWVLDAVYPFGGGRVDVRLLCAALVQLAVCRVGAAACETVWREAANAR